jgi:uncharacterized protein (TIGR02145 family)
MAENLKTSKYRNGDPINNVKDNAAWVGLSAGAYCWYKNDSVVNKSLYGALYNWYAVSDGRKIAPVGWHVPTLVEVSTLVTFLGGENVAGGKLKEEGTTHFTISNYQATNSSGYSALPGGLRFNGGVFDYAATAGYWWSSSEFSSTNSSKFSVASGNDDVFINNSSKTDGVSVRCIKD